MTGPSVERIEVTGIVQGVGFRPFIHRLAHELGLEGHVGNDSAGVVIEVAGDPNLIEDFARRITIDAPPLASIHNLSRTRASPKQEPHVGFTIIDSRQVAGPSTLVPPDTSVCEDCLRELFDPTDRRYQHPFITCTNCGPRFTIITGLPYDRPNTTMASFEMCTQCSAEYGDPSDRRYHAQPIGCHDCGPTLRFATPDGNEVEGVAGLERARDLLRSGRIVAIKGVGGFHLAVDATDDRAVARLRARKDRPAKPFAVMVQDLESAHRLASFNPAQERLLASPARPIVLADRLPDATIAPSVAPDNPLIGVVLAYTPVHHLLFQGVESPLVMTSANLAGEPITYRDADIEIHLGTVADGLVTNDRPIVAPCDDSVVRIVGETLMPVRRARGYAPIPVSLDHIEKPVLAVGGELKNTFCLSDGHHAWVSPHIGDMGTLATLRTFEETVGRFKAMYQVEPATIAVDAHPGYHTARWARRTALVPVHEVQHHHAHIAAVMAEHQLDPFTAVLGFAFDGTGYGDDGTVWGGEVLRATATSYDRLAHVIPVPLPGGDAAIEHPARIALAHLRVAHVDWDEALPAVAAVPPQERQLLDQLFQSGFGCAPTTSMGRLFDAVASIIGLRHAISFEAQAAIDLEHAARRNEGLRCRYEFGVADGSIDQRPVIRSIVEDLRRGRSIEAIADGFHTAVTDAVCALADQHLTGSEVIVLSGGVFQNALLTERTLHALRLQGHRVRTHSLVPPNDGGLALGQAFIATHAPTPQEI